MPATAFHPSVAQAALSQDPYALDLAAGRGQTLSVFLGLSFLAHALLLLIHFEFPQLSPFNAPPAIEVVLVNSKSATRPSKADALAQANLDGGGNTDKALRAKSNLPALPDMPSDTSLALAAQRVQQLEQEAERLMARIDSKGYTSDPATMPLKQSRPTDAEKPADLHNEELRVARLEAQIAKEWQAYQQLPKRKFLGARTQAVVYAEYVDDWRQRIERVGTANFPAEARQRATYGTVLVTVAVRADGTVEKVEIDRSSGSHILDAAVERIVQLGAPFKPFPPNVRKEADILHITRNWSFTRTDLLVQ